MFFLVVYLIVNLDTSDEAAYIALDEYSHHLFDLSASFSRLGVLSTTPDVISQRTAHTSSESPKKLKKIYNMIVSSSVPSVSRKSRSADNAVHVPQKEAIKTGDKIGKRVKQVTSHMST